MNHELEMEYEGALFTGVVSEQDSSFDHAFGTYKGTKTLIVEDFHVFVFINGIDYDITRALTDATLESFKSHFLEYANEQIRESA